MNETWWVGLDDLDDEQREVLKADPEEDLLIIGPPGSGKTNILVLRANYVRGVAPRALFITFTRTLTEFLRSGPNIGRGDQIKSGEITTFMAWGRSLLRENGYPTPAAGKDFDDDRGNLLTAISECLDNERTGVLYDVVFIDEVQDFHDAELQILRRVAAHVNAAGDSRQAIWSHKQGLPAISKMCTTTVELVKHYRIGERICEYADRILPPKAGDAPMLDGCNYDEDVRPSSVQVVQAANLTAQIAECLSRIRLQIRYISDEPILVLSQRTDVRDRLWESLIRIMTIASAKGSEARAVHILDGESLGTNRRELAFTGVTRAKTEVVVYHSEPLPGHLEPLRDALPELKDVF
jgi:superfamily I DNA/RNA helicase